MAHDPLATYLNDHLAGSVVAIRLMESLEATLATQPDTRAAVDVVAAVRHSVEADRDLLEQIVRRVGTSESAVRKTAGWIAERFAQLKLTVDDNDDGTFRMLEITEVVALGILGKRGLWRALRESTDARPVVHDLDFAALIARSESQYERMEALRITAARRAFACPSPAPDARSRA